MNRAKPIDMKNSTIESDFNNISSKPERDIVESKQKKPNFSSKHANAMPEQFITPPARVWDKIQAILDEQDNRRKSGENLINTSFGVTLHSTKRKNVYFATVAGFSLIAGFVWLIR